jgi:hypothetical protein
MRDKKKDIQFRGRTWVFHAFVQGELAFMLWESSLCCLNLRCALLFCWWCRPFASPWGVGILSILSQLCFSRCPWLRGPGLALSSDLVLAFIRLLITCLSSLLVSFFLSFMNWWLCVLSMHSSWGRLRTGASEDRWMVTPLCDEWLTTWCGLTLGRVLQVQVAAWFALVQVKSRRERS